MTKMTPQSLTFTRKHLHKTLTKEPNKIKLEFDYYIVFGIKGTLMEIIFKD